MRRNRELSFSAPNSYISSTIRQERSLNISAKGRRKSITEVEFQEAKAHLELRVAITMLGLKASAVSGKDSASPPPSPRLLSNLTTHLSGEAKEETRIDVRQALERALEYHIRNETGCEALHVHDLLVEAVDHEEFEAEACFCLCVWLCLFSCLFSCSFQINSIFFLILGSESPSQPMTRARHASRLSRLQPRRSTTGLMSNQRSKRKLRPVRAFPASTSSILGLPGHS